MEDQSSQITWQTHPARERPASAIIGVVVILAVAASVGLLLLADGFSPAVAIGVAAVSAALLILSLHRFYFPSNFQIDDEAITARSLLSTKRLEWARLRRFLHDERGAYLSTRARRSRLDSWQGLHILLPDADRDRIIAEIRARLQHASQGSGR